MPRQDTLAKVHAEIEAGRLYQARDRLHGLITSYPDDYTLRWLLGDVYWRLSYHAMAGRWWWLYPPERPETAEALKAFSKTCGNREAEMTRRSHPYPKLDVFPEGDGKERARVLISQRADTIGYEHTHSEVSGCTIGPIIIGSFVLCTILGLFSNLFWLLRLLS